MDLYSHAAGLPRQVPLGPHALSYQDLRNHGVTDGAIRWRADRTGQLHRLHRGTYLPGPTPPGLVGRARAALLDAPPLAVLGFQTAAQLHGFGVAPTTTIHLLVPAGTPFPQRTGISAHQAVLPIGRVVSVLGLPCAPPERCAVDLARTLRRAEALPVLDAALFAGAVKPEDLLLEVGRHDGLRGVRQARELVEYADGRAECRQESQLRLVLLDAGLTGFVPQLPVFDSAGQVRFRLDLGDRDRLIAVEYDGSSHLDPLRLRRDRARHNWLEERGWAMRYFTAADLYGSPETIVETVAAARRSRAYRRGKRSTSNDKP